MKKLLWLGIAGLIAWFGEPAGLAASSGPSEAALFPPVAVVFQGPIEDMGPVRWTVAGQPIAVEPDTVISEQEGSTRLGMWAQVEADWQGYGQLVGRRLETASSFPFPEDRSGFVGEIVEIGAEFWVVGDTRVRVTADTNVVGVPAVGGTAFVRAALENGALVAQLIAATPPGVELLLLTGQLVAVNEGQWWVDIGSRTVDVSVDAATLIRGTPVIGGWVEVAASGLHDGSLLGLVLTVLDEAERPVRFVGQLLLRVTATAPEQWTVLVQDTADGPWQARSLLVNLDTALVDESDGPLAEGAWVSVSARPPAASGQPWMASSIARHNSSRQELRGPIRSIDQSANPPTWVVGDTTVVLSSETRLDGKPRVGRYAIVRGTIDGDGFLWASRIAVRYVFQGSISARDDLASPRRWTIEEASSAPNKVVVLLDDSTMVDPGLETGDLDVLVEVQARAARQGWVAETVRLVNGP